MSHTPGPWATYPPEFTDGECWTVQEDGGMTVRVCGGDSPENRANANLIAAAPELLAAMKDLLDQMHAIGLPEWHGAEGLCFDRANAAVASAEGRVE